MIGSIWLCFIKDHIITSAKRNEAANHRRSVAGQHYPIRLNERLFKSSWRLGRSIKFAADRWAYAREDLWFGETYIVIGLFTTVLNSDLFQSDSRPRFDCVHGQLPLDRAIRVVPALWRAPPEFIVYWRWSINIDHQRQHYQAGGDRNQLQWAQRVG